MKRRLMTEEEYTMSEFLHLFTFEESVKMAYVPIIFTEMALHYAEEVTKICASRRLPYIKEVRTIRENIELYRRHAMGAVSPQVVYLLREQLDSFFETAARDVQTFWFVVNQELKKKHPELDSEYDLLTYLYMSVSVLCYVRKFEMASDMVLSERLGKAIRSTPNHHSSVVWATLKTIAGKYKVDASGMINLAIRVLRNKVDSVLKEQIKEYENRKKITDHGN